ncbi:MAG: phenylalanine--tRNA ligase subunit beta [Corynebacterium sp.]|nr:phenylalanine--tRNA ligase subunit beta [Corynebacterium sp.]
MFIAKNWLLRLIGVDPAKITDEEMDSAFVRVGFETEGYAPIPETTGPLVVGRVEEIEELTGFKKPIRFCQVNVGNPEMQQIICGARNFEVGSYVVVALPGAVLPGDFKIAARKTYDHVSEGMLCSAAELGMADKQTKGIITLTGEPTIGMDARELLGLDDTVFEVNITPDRGYALSARGLAREVASALDVDYVDVAKRAEDAIRLTCDASFTLDVPAPQADLLTISVDPATKMRRFGLRKVTGIDPKAESPLWMQRELMLCGQRPVNLATDITNFVMFLLGQPMHAFDAGKIAGGLQIRQAKAGEKLVTLDEQTRELHPEDVVICDDEGIQSLAAVMGGSTSEISDDTTDVYFEAANWDPVFVARTCRRQKLSSEASRRFERGVDPAMVEVALDLACSLLVTYGGGQVEASRTLIGEIPAMPEIIMDAGRPAQIIGVPYTQETVVARLEEVGCQVTTASDAAVSAFGSTVAVPASTTSGLTNLLSVVPPTWRPDLTMSADLVEEVVRLEGLDAIPSITPQAPAGRGLTEAQIRRRAIGHALAYQGYAEILPTPFMSNTILEEWGVTDERTKTVKVLNPLESDHGVLATTLLPAMLESLGRNVARGENNVRLFGQEQVSIAYGDGISPMPATDHRPSNEEIQAVLDALPIQQLHVATVACGKVELDGPWGEGREYTWADAIESARMVARAADVELEVENAEMLPWHPGRCAALKVNGEIVGYAGELHPQLLGDLPPRTCAMEINVAMLPFAPSTPAPIPSPFPVLLQDVALVVNEDVPAETVRKVLAENVGPLAESVELFDIYRSPLLGLGKKSLAFNIRFRAADRTLTDDECSEARMKGVEAASRELGAVLRG